MSPSGYSDISLGAFRYLLTPLKDYLNKRKMTLERVVDDV